MPTNGRQPAVFDGQTSNVVRSGAGTCSCSTTYTSTSVVKDVRGTGDPKGIIDAIGRRQSALRRRLRRGAVCASLTCCLSCTRWAVIQGKVALNLHLYGGTRYPTFSSANLTCRQNGGVKPAICHKPRRNETPLNVYGSPIQKLLHRF